MSESPTRRAGSEGSGADPGPVLDVKEQLRLEQLRCSRLVAANQILRETQQYLLDKCAAVTEEANRLATEAEASQSAATTRELALAADHDRLRQRLEDARQAQARAQQLEETNRELHASLEAAHHDKAVLVAQVTMLQQMLERLTSAHEQLIAAQSATSSSHQRPEPRTSEDREPSYHGPRFREDLTSPPPPPPPEEEEPSSPVSSSADGGRAQSEGVAARAILPMQQALDELYQAEGHPAGRGDGLSLLQEVLAQKRTADPFYDTFDAIDRVPPVRNGSVASSETSSIASQPPIVKGTSVKDLAKNFDAMNESRRSPSAASLERLLEKDRSRRERLIPDLLPQRHPTYMSTTVVMGSTPHPTPQPQHNLARSATKTRPDGPDVALGASPGRSGSVEAATPRGSD